MMIDVLNNIFLVSAIVGFVIPLLSIFSSWIGNIFGFSTDVDADFDMDFDADLDVDVDFDMDIDVDVDVNMDVSAEAGVVGTGSGAVPFNVMCLCLFLIVFGVLGKALLGFMDSALMAVLLTLASVAAGALFYALMYKFLVKKLKASNPVALSMGKLVGSVGKVSLRITAESMGTVTVKDSTGAPLSFRAKIDPVLKDMIGDEIPTGTTITVTGVDLDEKLCYVSTLQSKFKQDKIEMNKEQAQN